MTCLRNILFCCACLLLTFSALGYKALQSVDLLPAALDNGTRSYLEGKAQRPLPELSLSAFEDGTLQKEAESYIGQYWPAKDRSLLANAAWQRAAIRMSASLFGYDSYPTFFGSQYAYTSSCDAVASFASKSSAIADDLDRTIDLMNELAARNPSLRLFLLVPEQAPISPVLPLTNLQSGVADFDYWKAALAARLSEDIAFVDDASISPEDFYAKHFRTDHHWNIDGCLAGYELLTDAMGVEGGVSWSGRADLPAPMYGSFSRSGVCPTQEPDAFYDYLFDLPDYAVSYPTKSGGLELLQRGAAIANAQTGEQAEPFYDRYAQGYPYREWLTTIENPEVESGSLLIVGDSFSRPLDRLLATHYKTTYLFDPRTNPDVTIEELLASCPADDVVFVTTTNMLVNDDFMGSLEASDATSSTR